MYCKEGLLHVTIALVPFIYPSFLYAILLIPTNIKYRKMENVTYSSQIIFPNLHVSIKYHPLGCF